MKNLESIKELDNVISDSKEAIKEQEETIKRAEKYFEKVTKNVENFWLYDSEQN